MNEALIYCLAKLGNGDPKNWRLGADSLGSFTIKGHEPWLRCSYSQKEVVLTQRAGAGGATYRFKPGLLDSIAKKAGQMSIF